MAAKRYETREVVATMRHKGRQKSEGAGWFLFPLRLSCLFAARGFRGLHLSLLLVPLVASAAARPVTIGLVAPPDDPGAASLRCGAQLAVIEANESGEAPVALEIQGEKGQWGTVGNDAVTLVCDRRVDGVVTPPDGAASHLILQVAGRTQVPVASVCPDSSVTDAGVPWAVRVVARTDQEAAALFNAEPPRAGGATRWWAVVPAGRPGRPIRHDLESAARATGSRLERLLEDDPAGDPARLAGALAAASPDAVLLWLAPARAGAMTAALRAAGFRGRLAGPGRLDSEDFLQAAGAAAAGMQVAGNRAPEDRQFVDRFRHEFGRAPDTLAASAHDAAWVLIDLLRRSADGAGYRQFPLSSPTEGVTGVLHFDPSGNRTDPLQLLTCRDGRFVPLASTLTRL